MSSIAPAGYYAASSAPAPRFDSLSGTAACDFCIVGGGYTGLSAALHLAGAGQRPWLLEANTIGFQASGRNGGQIHSGHRKSQTALERWLGRLHARDLWSLSEEATLLVRDLIARHDIDCDFAPLGIISAAHDKSAARQLRDDAEHLDREYGHRLTVLDANEIASRVGTDKYVGGTYDGSGGHLHPLKFARGLAAAASRAGAVLYENSRVVRVVQTSPSRTRINTAEAQLTARHVILACDAFSGDVIPALRSYIGHVESFIVATEPLRERAAAILPCNAAVADTRHVLDYFRKSPDGRLLFGGRESYFWPPKDIARFVRPRMGRVFPALADKEIEFAWQGTVGITVTRMPHFGRLGEYMLFAHGYSGHGVALSVLAGKLLAEACLGRSEGFDVFARVPAKPFPGGSFLRRPLIAGALAWYKIADAF